jgi:hypothetical protein
MKAMKPIPYARHEAQESPALERKEHATGQELSKTYRPMGRKEPGGRKAFQGRSMRGGR